MTEEGAHQAEHPLCKLRPAVVRALVAMAAVWLP